MGMVDTIVVALDFNETEDAVITRATDLARQFGACLQPVHALDILENKDRATNHVEQACAIWAKAGLSVLKPIVIRGYADSVILSVANSCDANMIIVGARRKTLADRLLQGVTANKIIHKAVMPVWVVHQEKEAKPIKNILCPIDFSSFSEQALRTAIHLCHDWDAKLQVMHVITPDAKASAKFDHDKLTEQFRKFCYRASRNHQEVDQILVEGHVSEIIMSKIEELDIDLVVMGAVGQGSILDQFIGNNSDRTLRRASCCVLTIRHQDIFRVMHEGFEGRECSMGHDFVKINAEELAKAIEQLYGKAKDYAERGMLDEALEAYQDCLDKDNMFSQAYEGIADIYTKLGKDDLAAHYNELARDRRRIVWQQRVQANVRQQHAFFTDISG